MKGPSPYRIHLEGTTQGFWQVLAYKGCDGKKSWYKCRCSKCGAIKLVRADKLRSGKSRQCASCSAVQCRNTR